MHLMHLFRVAAVYRVQLVHLILAVGNFGLTTVFWIGDSTDHDIVAPQTYFGHVHRCTKTAQECSSRKTSPRQSRRPAHHEEQERR